MTYRDFGSESNFFRRPSLPNLDVEVVDDHLEENVVVFLIEDRFHLHMASVTRLKIRYTPLIRVWIKDGLLDPFLECTKHTTSTGCLEGDLNAYLVIQ